MEVDLNRIIDQVVKDKNIKREVVIDTLEKAMLTAARRKFGPEREIEAQFNAESGEVELFEFKTVVAGAPANDSQISLEDAHRHAPDAEVEVREPQATASHARPGGPTWSARTIRPVPRPREEPTRPAAVWRRPPQAKKLP